MENNMYEYFDIVKDCYDSLSDDLSRKVFQARMNLDLGIWDGYMKLIECSGLMKPDVIQSEYGWVKEFAETQKPLYIYGAGNFGARLCRMLQREGVNIVGFLDRNYKNIVTKCGLPVLAPSVEGHVDSYIFIAPNFCIDEIAEDLTSKGINNDMIIKMPYILDLKDQYFEFPQHCNKDGMFIDAGCFDCDTSIRFAQWSEGKYTSILALEPDKENYKVCLKNAAEHEIKNIQVVNMGLWNKEENRNFGAFGDASGHISEEGEQSTQLSSLDKLIQDNKVSFIKMDIEGAELKALEGASKTIMRDKPLCAISVYHKPGDQIALMTYLKSLVPEYHFALRHYSSVAIETVLYAFIK